MYKVHYRMKGGLKVVQPYARFAHAWEFVRALQANPECESYRIKLFD